MAGFLKTPHHINAHATQSDHSQFHIVPFVCLGLGGRILWPSHDRCESCTHYLGCLNGVCGLNVNLWTSMHCLSIWSSNYRPFRSVSKMAQRMSLDEPILSADVLTTFHYRGVRPLRCQPSKLNRRSRGIHLQTARCRSEHVCNETLDHSTSLLKRHK